MTLYGYYNNNDFVYLSLIGFSITLIGYLICIQLCIHALVSVVNYFSLNQEFLYIILYSSQAVYNIITDNLFAQN